MQMAQSHWWSLHVFIAFNWFNYMENEMVGCAIEFFSVSPSVGCYTEMTIFSCQEEKVMRLVLFRISVSSSIAAFKKLMVWFVFYCYRWKHFVLVSEAPTVLCGLRASQNLKSFLPQYIISEDYYMILAGGKTYSDFLVLFFILEPPCRRMIQGLNRQI